MSKTLNALLCSLIVILVVACVFGINGLVNSPYTDQQIQASLVDTWQVESSITTILIFLLGLVIAFSTFIAYLSTASTRLLAWFSVFLAIIAAVFAYASHVEFTNRVIQITGQSFGSFYGLF
jgi:hypothetical protein